jgi:hypothetical protein
MSDHPKINPMARICAQATGRPHRTAGLRGCMKIELMALALGLAGCSPGKPGPGDMGESDSGSGDRGSDTGGASGSDDSDSDSSSSDTGPACPVGSTGCPCDPASTCDIGLECMDGTCGPCPAGQVGCACETGGVCDTPWVCEGGVCAPPCESVPRRGVSEMVCAGDSCQVRWEGTTAWSSAFPVAAMEARPAWDPPPSCNPSPDFDLCVVVDDFDHVGCFWVVAVDGQPSMVVAVADKCETDEFPIPEEWLDIGRCMSAMAG